MDLKSEILDITPSHYKHNAILSIKNDRYSYEYDPLCETEISTKIHKILIEKGYGYHQRSTKIVFFEKPIEAGTIRNFMNTRIVSVTISAEYAVVFNVKFDVTNPLVKYDIYIPDFTYAYSQSIDDHILNQIYLELQREETHIKSNHIALLEQKLDSMLKVTNNSHKELIEYMDTEDIYNDMINYHIPSDEELESRRIRRNKTESEYLKINENIINIIDDILSDVVK